MSQYRHLTAAELVRQVRASAGATPLERELADRLDLALRVGGTANIQGLPSAADAMCAPSRALQVQGPPTDSEGGHHD